MKQSVLLFPYHTLGTLYSYRETNLMPKLQTKKLAHLISW